MRGLTICLHLLEILLKHFNSYWNTTDINVYLNAASINTTENEAAQALETLFIESQKVEVNPPTEPENATFAYTDFGIPGTVVSDGIIEDLDVRQLILSNNIHVNLKTTDFEDGSISIVFRFGSGKLGQPQNSTYLDVFTAYMVNWGGLGKHSREELDRAMAGKTWDMTFDVEDGAFVMSGTTAPRDLEVQLQIMTAHVVDPGFREEALGWWQGEVDAELNYLQNTLYGTFDFDMYGWLLGDDERFIEPTRDVYLDFEVSDAMHWLIPQLNNSYLEVSLVGDLDQGEAIELLLRTLGALPERSNSPHQITMAERVIRSPTAPQTKVISYETKVPQAATMMTWRIPSFAVDTNISQYRHFQVLADILSARAYNTIREELGAAYSPQAFADIDADFDYGYMFLYSEGRPEEMIPIADVMVSMTENLTMSGGSITDEEVTKAVLAIQSNYQESLRTNSYWLYSVLQECQTNPSKLDWDRSYEDDFNSVTTAAVNTLAMQYLTLDNALKITLLPTNGTSRI